MYQIQQEKYNRKAWQYQQLALPIAQNIEIAEDEPVFVANAQLEELDYRELYKAYSPIGRKSAAEPRIMFKLLVYGYMCGIYSTRKLEEACRKNIDFIWLLQGERVPDHCSIARFRSGKARDAIEGLFYQYVRRLAKEEEIQYEEVFIDGTKIESMANRYTFVWRKSVEKQLAKVKEKAKELFRQYGGNGNLTAGKLRRLAQSLVPEGGEMVRGTGRRKPSWQRQYEELEQLLERWDRYEAQLFEMAQQLVQNRQRRHLHADEGGPYGQRTTEARLQCAAGGKQRIHYRGGGLLPLHRQRHSDPISGAYPADAGQKLPGHCSGYESVGNYLYLDRKDQGCYIKPANYEVRKTKKYSQQIWRLENMQYLEREDCFLCAAGRKLTLRRSCSRKEKGMVTTMDYYRCEGCGGCPLREQCTTSRDPAFCKEVKVCREFAQFRDQALRQLSTPRGTLLRMNRSIQVEGAFGVLKSNRRFKRFLMRGKTNISLELFLLCLAFDLKKYWAKLQQGRLKSHLFPLKKE